MSRPNLWHDDGQWVSHATSVQPIPSETEVRVQYRTGAVSKYTYLARQLTWKQRGQAFDIAAYQVVKEAGE